MNDEKNKQVYKILIMPIVCTRYSEGKVSIVKCENIIKSTQSYYPYKKCNIPLDEDMSDFAIGFYEIVYKGILNGKKMIENDDLCDREFTGDTMNSFNYIANLFPQAGRCRNSRTPKSQWPSILQTWKKRYHCLANFWIIPLEIGRKNSDKLSKGSYENDVNDYVDRFIDLLKESTNFDSIFSRDYKSIEDFAAKQFLYGSYMYGDSSVVSYSNEIEIPETMINKIIDRIKIRATAIANSDCSIELWDYFNKWGLL